MVAAVASSLSASCRRTAPPGGGPARPARGGGRPLPDGV